MTNVFTYGSLMFAPVWQRVVAGHYRSAPAVLQGYQRFPVRGEEYPAIRIGDETASVSGVLYFDVSPADIKRLDDFEGEYYLRTAVDVSVSGKAVAAETYVLRPAWYGILGDGRWDVDAFEAHGIKAFLAKYKGFGEG